MDDTKRASATYPMDETGNWEATAAYTHQGAIFAYAPAHLYDPCETDTFSIVFVTLAVSLSRKASPSGSSWTWDTASTWEPVTRAPLLVCAHANSAVTTKSGVVMVAGRFPGLSLMVSWDDAMSWEFYLIDTSGFAANGALVELEPDGKSSAAAPFAFRGSLKEAAVHMQL